jgi:hypothetical protein
MKSQPGLRSGAVGLLMLGAVGCGMGRPTVPPPVAVATVVETPGEAMAEEVTSVAATVVKVDEKQRIVTLRDAAGRVFDVHVGDEVKNLPHVERGDQVIASYYESIAIMLRKPGEATPAADTAAVAARAEPGKKPGAMAGRQTTLTATVVGISKRKGTVTLKGPRGNSVTLNVRDPKRLEGVRVGDVVEAVYSEAIAISMEKPAKR